jgi:hypothetical protein
VLNILKIKKQGTDSPNQRLAFSGFFLFNLKYQNDKIVSVV